MSTSAVYNHRPMQPSGVRTNTAQEAPQPRTFSIVEPLETIKHEFEGIQAELVRVRSQKDEMEMKLDAQVTELTSIRRALFDLEAEHSRVRQQYEDEIHRLRTEAMALRQAGTTPQQPGAGLGISSRPRGPGLSEASPRFTGTTQPDSQQPHNRPISRGLPPTEREREHPPDKLTRESSTDRDPDRLSDHRDPKRHKARRENHPDMYPPPMGSQHPQSQSHPHAAGQPAVKPSLSYNNSLGLYRFPGQDSAPGGGSTLPPMNLNPPTAAGDELTLQNVPPEFRKEASDWYAVYNPKVKKSLDVNLVHTFNHATVVCCVQFSADGRYLATGCNRTAQIFDVHTGQKVCVVEDETAPKDGDLYIRSVRFSPDGKLLATGAEDRKIRVWDIAKRRVRHVFDGHQQEIYSLDFSRDGRHIVSGSGDKTMRIWNVQDNSCRTITISDTDSLNNDAGVTSVAISPDGALVAAGSLDTVVRIWDVASGTLLERLRGHSDSVYSVAFTPDGRGIVSGSLDKTLKYWDITSVVNNFSRTKSDPGNGSSALSNPISSSTMNFVGHKDFVLSVSVSNDGRWVVSGSKDRCVHFWDSRNAALQFILQGHKNSVISLDINPLGGMLATGSGDNTARMWTYGPI
ncbi:hypothetical protein GALMADRAFT_136894 [Galerina marginata CBS 339.88]|uniref:Transcriptional repressor Tup1 N-terminal domain-containing protein n=1 Tax=Galerina marginata (strain CBS 339.88) TaxID=685588 RepID=A0A067TKG6_GALM3|nr:hypothetical protein GALMADRAFT_136894 [Galerina marginata CBS 339.88]